MDIASILLIGVGALPLLFCVTAFLFLVYCGLMHDVKVSTGKPPIGKFTGAYKFHKGPYKDVGHIFSEAKSLNPKLKCFAVHYDDPEKVPAEELRSLFGSILAEDDDEPNPDLVKLYTSHGYKLFDFPAIPHSIVSSFPFVTSVSTWLATTRVYPAMDAYVKEMKLSASPWLNIYCDGKIHFMAALSKQLEFYLPEAEKPQLESTMQETGKREIDWSKSHVQ